MRPARSEAGVDLGESEWLQCVCEMHQGRPAEEIIKAGAVSVRPISRSAWRGRRNEVVLKASMPVIVVK